MIISHYIKEFYEDDLYHSKAFDFYFKGLNFGVLDIETTGLSPDNSSFILGGLLNYKEKTFEQYFAEDLSEEKEVLEKFIDRLKFLDVILTYNGQSFDLPFILRRAKILGIDLAFNMPYNFDLYLVLNSHSHLRKILPNLKQKTIEYFMGVWVNRADEISGKESVDLYYLYLKTRDSLIREKILLHNRDDVLQLSKLLPIIEKSDFHKAMHCLGFIVKTNSSLIDSSNSLIINKININDKELAANGKQTKMPIDYYSYGNNTADFKISFSKSSCSFQLSIPLENYSGNIYLDTRKYAKNFRDFEKYAFIEKDFLLLKTSNKINYLETNHFIISFLSSLGEI